MEIQPDLIPVQDRLLSKHDWLVLSFIKGVGPARLDRLFIYLQTLLSEQKVQARLSKSLISETITFELLVQLKWPVETAKVAFNFLSKASLPLDVQEKITRTYAWLDESPLHHLVLKGDADYPKALSQINVAPLFLYVKGHLQVLSKPKIAIVGARKATVYGLDMAYRFSQHLAEHGYLVVSGGAIGIDSAAHQGALSVKACTLVVMGSGLLHLYPKKNKSLFDTVIKNQGCLISEYPLQTRVQARLFPARNRIISGLSLGVIVVEAGFKSGSLISANYALQQNREVFAIPGRITDKASEACLDLIKQGAKLITQIDDVLQELPHIEDQLKPTSMPSELNLYKANDVYPMTNNQKNDAVSRETNIKEAIVPSSYNKKELTDNEFKILEFMDMSLIQYGKKNEFELNQLVSELNLGIQETMQACMQLELIDLIAPLITGYARCSK